MVFIVVLVVILLVIYFIDCRSSKENFNPNLMFSNSYTPEPVDYTTRAQDCNELTWSPSKCVVNTVVPPNVNVCGKSLSPITNNQKECGKNKKTKSKSKPNPTVSLKYDFDLLPSFNNAQQNDILDGQETFKNINTSKSDNYVSNSFDLETDIRSLNSLENDLISNY